MFVLHGKAYVCESERTCMEGAELAAVRAYLHQG